MKRGRHPGPAELAFAAGLLCLGTAQVAAQTNTATLASTVALRVEAKAYEHGEGVGKDLLWAAALYCEAARLGDADAQYDLGWMYANGRGVARSDALAAALFALAAAQQHPQAQAMLRHMDAEPELPDCMRDHSVAPEDSPPASVPPEEESAFVVETPAQQRVVELVQRLAPEFQVSPLLALAVIRAESNFNPLARSSKNAQGLMQLIPETSARFNVKTPYDAVKNLRGGLAYLRWLLAYFRGSVPLVVAAYNAGEGTVDRYRGIPPFAETRAYVERVMAIFRKPVHPFDASVTDASPALQRFKTVTYQ